MMTKDVDTYFEIGCMRCPLGGTSACKVHTWEKELALLRTYILDCGLDEESKWGVPCYTWKKANVLILAAFKDYASVSFFKGSLLQDVDGVLHSPGENSQAARSFKFDNVKDIKGMEDLIKAYIYEAIEVENAGLKVEFKQKNDLQYPVELQQKLDEDPVFAAAFEALTPGRRRGYNLFFSAPKQAKTREGRIEKWVEAIMEGRGMYD